MPKLSAFLLCSLLLTNLSYSQSVVLTNWSTLSSLQTVRDVSLDSKGNLWAATSGGVFRVHPESRSVTEYRNINALQSLDARTVYGAPEGKVYVGGGNGALDIVNEDSTWTNITDIVRANEYPKRGINDMISRGDTLIIATDFGVVTLSIAKELFIETIDRIGSLQEKTRVNGVVIFRDSIWVATDAGVAVAPLAVATLRLPSEWFVISTIGDKVNPLVGFIHTDGSTLTIAEGSSVYTWNGASFVRLFEAPSLINGLSISNSNVYASTSAGVLTATEQLQIPFTGPLTGHASIVQNENIVIIGFVKYKAMQIWDGAELELISINSPISSQFAGIDVDINGGVWVATDVDPPRTGLGVSYFNGATWTNYTTANTPELKTDACYRVSALSNGKVYIGTWGGGALEIKLTDTIPEVKRLDNNNSALQGITIDPKYVLSADVVLDNKGVAWMVNEQSSNQLMISINTDGSSVGYYNCADPGNTAYRTIAVDEAGNKWVGSYISNGITVFNEKDPSTSSDDICNSVQLANSQIPDNLISALKTDRTGALWIGTPKGAAVISSPWAVTNTTLPYLRRIPALGNAIVNDIYVDALNYKWIATTGGVYVLNEDGTEVLASITRSNAPLLDDNIRSVAVDINTGIAYFGTAFGCSVAQSSSIRPLEKYALSFRPQPFTPQTDGELILDGLAEDSDVRILTVGGFMVGAMQTRGRQALWDGRDIHGNYVPPGVYLVVVKSATTGESSLGKVMVK
ncbi:MAG: hypothetical protein HYX66_01425 [Ignavibacteria bacterium]|nr:hypothetical protein [Ignavibacteria bacterium]